MKTYFFSDGKEDIEEAGRILARGGLVAFPTETVYGLGANALDPEAVKRIYLAKGRPSDNPTIVHIAEADDMLRITDRVTEDMKKLVEAFWPGPLTMVVPKLECVPEVTTGGLGTVGIRMPRQAAALSLIRSSGCPVAAPSANLSGKPSPTTAEHVKEDLSGRIDAIIDGGPCGIGIESTVVDMTGETPVILRPGYITREDLQQVLGKNVEMDPTLFMRPEPREVEDPADHVNVDVAAAGQPRDGRDVAAAEQPRDGRDVTAAEQPRDGREFRPKAPGMKYTHYAPKAEMIIFQAEADPGPQASGDNDAGPGLQASGDKDAGPGLQASGEDEAGPGRGHGERLLQAIEQERQKLTAMGKKVAVLEFSEGEAEEAARQFFARLRQADLEGVDVILAAALPEKGIGFSLMNRMLKAAGYNIRKV